MAAAVLTKSLFQSGRQCRKRLWLEVHRPELKTADPAAQLRIDDGIRLGEIARKQFGNGLGDERVAIPDSDFDKALAQTEKLLAHPPTHRPLLFEPAFEHDGVRIRVDVLMRFPAADRLIEVKAGTQPKEEYFWDCAIQTWVLRGVGRTVQTISLALVDKAFVCAREGDWNGLFALDDYTLQVEALLPQVPALVADFKTVIGGPEPAISTGRHCGQPYDCPFLTYCRAAEPPLPDYPIDDLPRASAALLSRLRAAGYSDLRHVPLAELDSPIHRGIASAVLTEKPQVSGDFGATLDGLGYPRHYLDFETISSVAPRWVGTRPNQQVPFQFSCDVEQADGSLSHHEFLDLTGNNPSADLVTALLRAIGDSGPIVVWYQPFESSRLRELANAFPQYAEVLLRMVERIVDLLAICKDHYYHRDMHGSWSIKKVLPTVAPDLDYTVLDIADGDMAQVAYRRAVAPGTSDEERETIRRSLLTYCALDTFAMVRLARWRPA